MQGKTESTPAKAFRKRASRVKYVSPNQLTICGFETPFEQKLSTENRWVKLSGLIPWDKIVSQYDNLYSAVEGRPPINGRLVLGTIIIKHFLDLTDRETIAQIEENMFMQYFIGYTSFSNSAPFSHTMLSKIRKKLNVESISKINDLIIGIKSNLEKEEEEKDGDENDGALPQPPDDYAYNDSPATNKGRLLMDATVAPQNITFPTDLKILNASRIKLEEIIDKLYIKKEGNVKPRTYREEARKAYLNTAKKKSKSYKQIYEANGQQLRYVKRNLLHVANMLSVYLLENKKHPLSECNSDYLAIIRLVYAQQYEMHSMNKHTIENRIVSIHQPHVRPIVRGKSGVKVEFGSKLHVSMVDGFAYLDKLSWNNFNESTTLKQSIKNYKKRNGFYPKEVLADQIYCNRENRRYLKALGIDLKSKPLGRPTKDKALSILVSPGERNPMEGKFGQGKVGYGMNNIRAKLKSTSESRVALIFLVLNLVNLTRLRASWTYYIDFRIIVSIPPTPSFPCHKLSIILR